jgi:hypothetical protein
MPDKLLDHPGGEEGNRSEFIRNSRRSAIQLLRDEGQ